MRRNLRPDQAAEIAAAVRTARRRGVKWKTLAAVYNRSVRQLQRFVSSNETQRFAK